MDKPMETKDPPPFSTHSPHTVVTMKDTAEPFREEEDRINYPQLNDVYCSLPAVSCTEKIIICMDPSMETAGESIGAVTCEKRHSLCNVGHVLKSKEGSNQESLINICKNALEMFICTKSAINKRHQFGLITLCNSAAWTRDPSSAKDEVIRDMRHLDPIDVEDIFDLTTLFAVVKNRVK